MPEARLRRKALAAAPPTPAPLPALFAEESRARPAAPPPPPRRVRRDPARRALHRADDFDYFDAPRRTDVSLAAPQPRIDFPARDDVPHHWEYAAAAGILAAPAAPAPRPRRTPCRTCEDRVRRSDFFSAALHYACVRAVAASTAHPAPHPAAQRACGDAGSPRRVLHGLGRSARPGPSGGDGADGECGCGRPRCPDHCALRRAAEDADEGAELDADVTGSDRSVTTLTARMASMPNPGLYASMQPPYRTTAKMEDGDYYNGEVTAHQAARGNDIQGIPWENLPFSRDDLRATRLRSGALAHGENPDNIRSELGAEPRRHAEFFTFFANTRRVRCSYVHFQLRNLCYATSKHDVCVMNRMAIVHWDAAARRKAVVLDLSGSALTIGDNLPVVQISTIFAKDDLVFAGGFYGEVVCKSLTTGKVVHNHRVSLDENSITNAIDMFDNNLLLSNNDCCLRTFDIATWQRLSEHRFDTAVNHATRQAGGKLVCAVGDDNFVQVIDGDNGDRVASLRGHEDFSFATAWHPNGRYFATGSQDRTCRIWDVRNMSQSLRIVGAKTGPVRSLRFASSGAHLMIAEQKDFVHLYGCTGGAFDTVQELDLFGEIAGVSFSPSGEGLFVAVADRAYSSIVEFQVNRSSKFVYGSLP